MKSKLNVALLLALSVGASGKLAMAQNQAADLQVPQAQYAVFHPEQNDAALQMTAWGRDRDGDRCDGDHDRDDRNCRYRRDRDDRYRNNNVYRNNGYYGNNNGYGNNGYYGNSGYNGYPSRNNNGWYDRNGNFHPQGTNGYYDRNGNWHSR